MRRHPTRLLAVAATLVLAACGGGDMAATTSSSTAAVAVGVTPQGFGTVSVQVTAADGTERVLCLYLAATPDQRARGLMEVTSLGGRDGMLFRFDADTESAFYMFRTLMPLSIAWFDGDGGFVSQADMAPCPSTDPGACPLYPPAGSYRDAVEVPQGGLPALGIGPGSRLAVAGEAC